ncbi:hypothetical protein [Elizabethkingia meningoseptica]|uniref:hypothetical protein n=1 Tax=Elizabethkingia meningoseptica TaxID=238 RepID=UPI0038912446
MMNNFQKEEYRSPMIEISLIEMEQGVAAGSARVLPADLGNNIQEMWLEDSSDDRTIEW